MTTLSLVSRQLNAENKDQILGSIRGKSRSEVEQLLAAAHPQTKTVERVRPIVVAPRVEAVPATPSKEAGTSAQATSPQTLSLFNALRPSPEKVKAAVIVPAAPTPVPEKRYALSFSVDEKTFAELEEVKALLSSSLPQGVSLEEALKELYASKKFGTPIQTLIVGYSRKRNTQISVRVNLFGCNSKSARAGVAQYG